jgi:mannose-6-phosphate isomerase
MTQATLYPLKFDPIYQYRIWGGRRLEHWTSKPLPPYDLIGEAWILSDRDDHPSKVLNGPLKDKTIKELLADNPEGMLGKYEGMYDRFPLLLKFLDAQKVLSVQVHPSDDKPQYIPKGEHGKTEAWVVLEAGPDARIYTGLKSGTDEQKLRDDLKYHKVAEDLSSFQPKAGEAVFIKAGTVHTLQDLVVFEVQQNSDVTYRLYDWDRVDEKTGKPRDLQVEEALACIDYSLVDIGPVTPVTTSEDAFIKEKIFDSDKFRAWRLTCRSTFMIGEEGTPRILIGISGTGEIQTRDESFDLAKGETMLIPASVGPVKFVTRNKAVILEVALPEDALPNHPR